MTRSVLNKIKVCDQPLVYLLDTPGILEPQVRDVEAGFRLALCGMPYIFLPILPILPTLFIFNTNLILIAASMQDHLVGIINIADYLLYWLNKNGHFR